MRISINTLVVSIFLFSATSLAKETIVASVSPGFPDGLHAKYFQFLADELNQNIRIKPLPLARRVKELEKGDVDIIIFGKDDNPALVALMPAYTAVTEMLFVSADDRDKITNTKQLKAAIIGLSQGANSYSMFEKEDYSNKVRVKSLSQKIQLLERNRIDGFFHTALSTNKVLTERKLSDAIMPSRWQPKSLKSSSHFIISKKSHLFARKDELEKVIEKAKREGKFKEIRSQYYQRKK
ncbi:substrate-binding periplasmic protein [Thalassotalea montiporae]